jgi:polyketide cyclase/dehydrase/lipid transport protein
VAEPSRPPLIAVRTSIDINAAPEQVWRNVIAFADIQEAPEWYFRSGIAYPLRARIRGTGAGAVRYCIFTTGAFVEPIQVWDEPHRLAFSVTHNPAPMDELSPYAAVRPPHLDGFFVSERGEFLLQPLGAHRTRLTGTTWYRNALYPAAYWRIWSDAIIHRIHLRVLRHIRSVSES